MSYTPDTSPVIEEEGDHRRLVAEADFYATLAGIPKAALWVPLGEHATEREVAWARAFKRHSTNGIHGMIWSGKHTGVMERAQALAGCLVRNFIDARVRTRDQVLDDYEECSCLIIPDLYFGEPVKDWQREKVIRALLKHRGAGHMLVAYVSDPHEFVEAYGPVANSILDGCPAVNLS